eukprot:TRINITY_DN53151_c0_g1_i1.p1 TRINITY_DN53151_c0_g1~~TRINITY_DN53151_c0_g1_i1.p1  ORF type:complete len:267 (+),score=72.56 TRINITY_DN53151_c0_g1_i1:21-821(+)
MAYASHGAMAEHDEDQIAVGIQIIQRAFQRKMQSLESEIKKMELTCDEHRSNVNNLERKNNALQVELVESKERSQQLHDEEKELYKTLGSLKKQIVRLEGLKAAVMKEIQDDQHKEAELGDTKALMSDEYLRGTTPLTAADMGYGPPRAESPPRVLSPPRGPAPPQASAYQYEPTSSLPEARPRAGYAGPTAQATSSPVVDGKAFFRLARSRLPYEDFNKFLAAIKRLNNAQQTREETLREASQIFGPERSDLYRDFENLLTRHGM